MTAFDKGADHVAHGVGVVGGALAWASPETDEWAAVGGMAVCSLANDQGIADAFVAEATRMKDDHWYNGYLGSLYLLAMSGNMWAPNVIRQQD